MLGEALSFMTVPEVAGSFKQTARVILHNGDSASFLKSVPDKVCSLVITSPPYNLGKEYETKSEIGRYLKEGAQVIDEVVRVLKDGGSICWQVGNCVDDSEIFPLDVFYYPMFKERGLKLRNRIVWHFGHGLHASRRFSGRYETLLWFTKGDNYIFNLNSVRVAAKYPGKRHYKGPNKGKPSGNPLGKNPSDVWDFICEEWDRGIWEIPNVKANHPEKTIHPCQFPVELAERCVLALTCEDDFVLDPYCGVGSALIAGLKQNRRVMGCDKEIKYVEIAADRIRRYFAGSLKVRALGTPVHVATGREAVSRIPEEWSSSKKQAQLL